MHYIPFQARPCGPPCCTSPRAFHAHSTPVLHCASAVGSTEHGRSAQRPTSHSLSRDPGRENRNPLAPTAWTQPSRKRSPPTAPRLSALAFSTPAISAHSERRAFLCLLGRTVYTWAVTPMCWSRVRCPTVQPASERQHGRDYPFSTYCQ